MSEWLNESTVVLVINCKLVIFRKMRKTRKKVKGNLVSENFASGINVLSDWDSEFWRGLISGWVKFCFMILFMCGFRHWFDFP